MRTSISTVRINRPLVRSQPADIKRRASKAVADPKINVLQEFSERIGDRFPQSWKDASAGNGRRWMRDVRPARKIEYPKLGFEQFFCLEVTAGWEDIAVKPEFCLNFYHPNGWIEQKSDYTAVLSAEIAKAWPDSPGLMRVTHRFIPHMNVEWRVTCDNPSRGHFLNELFMGFLRLNQWFDVLEDPGQLAGGLPGQPLCESFRTPLRGKRRVLEDALSRDGAGKLGQWNSLPLPGFSNPLLWRRVFGRAMHGRDIWEANIGFVEMGELDVAAVWATLLFPNGAGWQTDPLPGFLESFAGLPGEIFESGPEVGRHSITHFRVSRWQSGQFMRELNGLVRFQRYLGSLRPQAR